MRPTTPGGHQQHGTAGQQHRGAEHDAGQRRARHGQAAGVRDRGRAGHVAHVPRRLGALAGARAGRRALARARARRGGLAGALARARAGRLVLAVDADRVAVHLAVHDLTVPRVDHDVDGQLVRAVGQVVEHEVLRAAAVDQGVLRLLVAEHHLHRDLHALGVRVVHADHDLAVAGRAALVALGVLDLQGLDAVLLAAALLAVGNDDLGAGVAEREPVDAGRLGDVLAPRDLLADVPGAALVTAVGLGVLGGREGGRVRHLVGRRRRGGHEATDQQGAEQQGQQRDHETAPALLVRGSAHQITPIHLGCLDRKNCQ